MSTTRKTISSTEVFVDGKSFELLLVKNIIDGEDITYWDIFLINAAAQNPFSFRCWDTSLGGLSVDSQVTAMTMYTILVTMLGTKKVTKLLRIPGIKLFPSCTSDLLYTSIVMEDLFGIPNYTSKGEDCAFTNYFGC